MPINLNLTDLMDYTDWERHKWYEWLRQHGDEALKIRPGPMAMVALKPWGRW